MDKGSEPILLPDIKSTFEIATLSDIASPEFSAQYGLLVDYINKLTELKKTVDDKIKDAFEKEYQETGETHFEADGRKYTYIPATTRVTVDTKRLQTEQPDVYAKYAKVSQVSASIKSTSTKEK